VAVIAALIGLAIVATGLAMVLASVGAVVAYFAGWWKP
jgi:hypothetical protein